VFCAEVNIDAIATAQLMGTATRHIKVGTWVAHIYLRLPYLCAKAAALAADATSGRFILGLGVSHQPVNQALGIDMPNPAAALRDYTIEVANWLAARARRPICRSSPRPIRCRSTSRR